MRFQDIPQFTRAKYSVDIGWGYLETAVQDYKIDLEPEYQREHVWTPDQQSAYVEYMLRGGESGKDLYFNYAIVDNPNKERTEIVDGKQRLTAVRLFMADKLPAFGLTLSQFEDRLVSMTIRFTFNINDLQTEAEVIQWYLDLNYAGTPHTEEERARVQKLLEKYQ